MFWQLKVAAAVILAAGSFYMGKVYEKAIWQAKELEYQAQIEQTKKQAAKVAYEYEVEKSKKTVEQREIIRKVYVEVTKPAYSCQLPIDGLRVVNKAIDNANSGKSGGAVSTNKKH